jgi:hypothetical protein
MRRRRSPAVTVVVIALGLTLTACGTGTMAKPTPSAPAPSSPLTVGTASTPLTSETLARVEADLGAVHNDINQATVDLTNPKPDS